MANLSLKARIRKGIKDSSIGERAEEILDGDVLEAILEACVEGEIDQPPSIFLISVDIITEVPAIKYSLVDPFSIIRIRQCYEQEFERIYQ